jgi:hypothetical protein
MYVVHTQCRLMQTKNKVLKVNRKLFDSQILQAFYRVHLKRLECMHDSNITSDLVCKFKPMRNVIGKISVGLNILQPITKMFVSLMDNGQRVIWKKIDFSFFTGCFQVFGKNKCKQLRTNNHQHKL